MKHFAFLFSLLALGQSAPGVIVDIPASRDNTLYENASGAVSNGVGEHFFAGQTGPNAGNALRRGLLAFDFAGLVPAGAVIQSVSLRLNLSLANFFVPEAAFALHPVLGDWGEGTSDAGTPGGAGTASTAGDATWQHRFFSDSLWTTPGGDFRAAPSLSTTLGGVGTYDLSSAQMVADVQAWVNTPSSNFGWLVRGSEDVSNAARRFDSREHSIAANRPALTVTFEPVPEPVAGVLVGCGFVAFAARRRRTVQGH